MMQHNYRKVSKQQSQAKVVATLEEYVTAHFGEAIDLEAILEFFPLLAQRVVEKTINGGTFDKVKFQQVLKEGSQLSWHLRRALARVIYDEFITQNNAKDEVCRRECKRFIKKVVMAEYGLSIWNILTRLTTHMTTEMALLDPNSYFRLRIKVHGMGELLIIDPDTAPDYFLRMPFVLLLNSPNIVEIALLDPQIKWHKKTEAMLKRSEIIMRAKTPIGKLIQDRDVVTPQWLDDQIYNEKGNLFLRSPSRLGNLGTQIDPVLWETVEKITGLNPSDSGGCITLEIFTRLASNGIYRGVDLAYIYALCINKETQSFNSAALSGILKSLTNIEMVAGGGATLKAYLDLYIKIRSLLNLESENNPNPTSTIQLFNPNPAKWDISIDEQKILRDSFFNQIMGKMICENEVQDEIKSMFGEELERVLVSQVFQTISKTRTPDAYGILRNGFVVGDGKYYQPEYFWSYFSRDIAEQADIELRIGTDNIMGFTQNSGERFSIPRGYVLATTRESVDFIYRRALGIDFINNAELSEDQRNYLIYNAKRKFQGSRNEFYSVY